MPKVFLLLILLSPLTSTSQDIEIIELYKQLEVRNDIAVTENKSNKLLDSLRFRLDKEFVSTGNPKENLSFQIVDNVTAFAYGNEVGYGIWPFLYKTSDGGKSWQKIFFSEKQYGEPIMKEHFYMFDKSRGILIHRYAPKKSKFFDLESPKKNTFTYFLTKDGGETWKRKYIKLNSKWLRYENHEQVMLCSYAPQGEVVITILQPVWNAIQNKRSIEDRKLYELRSEDFGKHFSQRKLR